LPKDDKNWTAAIRKVHPTARPGDETMICSLHFRKTDFADDSRHILQPSAVPIVLPKSFYTAKKETRTPATTTTTAVTSTAIISPLKMVLSQPPKRKAAQIPGSAMKLIKGDKSKTGSDCEDYIEIDWMKF
jgi:THAP domain